jgi:hypothetical protein
VRTFAWYTSGSRGESCGKKNMEVAGNANMKTIQTHMLDALAVSTAAGSLIYISEDRRRENLFQKW